MNDKDGSLSQQDKSPDPSSGVVSDPLQASTSNDNNPEGVNLVAASVNYRLPPTRHGTENPNAAGAVQVTPSTAGEQDETQIKANMGSALARSSRLASRRASLEKNNVEDNSGDDEEQEKEEVVDSAPRRSTENTGAAGAVAVARTTETGQDNTQIKANMGNVVARSSRLPSNRARAAKNNDGNDKQEEKEDTAPRQSGAMEVSSAQLDPASFKTEAGSVFDRSSRLHSRRSSDSNAEEDKNAGQVGAVPFINTSNNAGQVGAVPFVNTSNNAGQVGAVPFVNTSNNETITHSNETALPREEAQGEVAFDAYVVNEEEQKEFRQQRERELLQEIERREYDELVRTLPHAERVDPEELRKQREQEERAAAQRQRQLFMRKAAAATAVTVAVIVTCVVTARHLKEETKKETSREDQISWILEKVSGDAIYNKSSPRHDAFRWIVDTDPMKLNVGGEGVKSFTIVERYVMVLFFLVTGGLSNWTDTFGFLGNTSVCDWWDPAVYKGIFCHDSGSIRNIHGFGNNLYGTIPDELSALEELEFLVLFDNKLFGSIPSTLQKNTRLKRITLALNFLSGKIPDLSSLRNMQTIELFRNYLTGTLLGWVTSSTELVGLNVYGNLLSGTIPPFASQDGLERVVLSDNLFEGLIPPSVGALSVMETLSLDGNQLSGPIPTSIGQATKLSNLQAYSNSLTGTIPSMIGNLQELIAIGFQYNSLTGPIPTELGGLTALVQVSLYSNRLTGTIPTELAGLEELKYLYLQNNSLAGNVSELCFNQEDGHTNAGLEQLIEFYTDCEDIVEPEVVCPCCTYCCNDMKGACSQVKSSEELCQEKALQVEVSEGDDSGTVCDCSEGGQVVSCKDSSCMYCNDADGSLCYIDAGTGMESGIGIKDYFAVSIQYVRGRDELVTLQMSNGQCSAAINGSDCASCRGVTCGGDGYRTFEIDCSNFGYGGTLSACIPGNDPFVMLWDIANHLYYSNDFPIRHDCVPYNTSEAFRQA